MSERDEKASNGFAQMRDALKKNMYPDNRKNDDEKKKKGKEK
jgi:hypothetical protein